MKTAFTSTTSIYSWLRHLVFRFTLALIGGLAISLSSQAVTPPPDGGYPGGNTAEGQDALLSLTTGTYNTAAGYLTLKSNVAGKFNTAIGAGALLSNTADQNTAAGAGVLLSNTTGSNNTAMGEASLFFNTTGNNNTAFGASTLTRNAAGSDNTAMGVGALSNATGDSNTAIGKAALSGNTNGENNVALGQSALISNTTGMDNTAIGLQSLFSNTTGNTNTATGRDSLSNNTTGSFNTALGTGAGENLTTGDNNIDIDNPGVAGEAATIRIGDNTFQARTFIAGIRGVAVTGTAVVVSSSGQLGVAPSSKRFKNKITQMDKASESILALQPVTFRYKKEIDPKDFPQFGLVAEEVEKVNPDLVVRDKEGKPYTVRYDAVNAMLLNEFLKEHKKVQEQGATIAHQQKQIEALTAGLQKVNAQLGATNPTTQLALTNR